MPLKMRNFAFSTNIFLLDNNHGSDLYFRGFAYGSWGSLEPSGEVSVVGDNAESRREWVLSRNCSLSPRQLALAYMALCSVSLTVAIVFTLSGAWYILGFAIVELSAVGLAFFLYARHAVDREHIALTEECLMVELIRAEQVRQYRLNPRWTRVEAPEDRNKLISLESNGVRVEIGRFLTEWKRREFARELRRALASG